jgi:hypothetical protein
MKRAGILLKGGILLKIVPERINARENKKIPFKIEIQFLTLQNDLL